MTPEALNALSNLNLSDIALVVRNDWKKVWYGAVPYLDALSDMESIDQNYGLDTGSSVVAYFLSNATTWKGEVARAVKAELNKRLKATYKH